MSSRRFWSRVNWSTRALDMAIDGIYPSSKPAMCTGSSGRRSRFNSTARLTYHCQLPVLSGFRERWTLSEIRFDRFLLYEPKGSRKTGLDGGVGNGWVCRDVRKQETHTSLSVPLNDVIKPRAKKFDRNSLKGKFVVPLERKLLRRCLAIKATRRTSLPRIRSFPPFCAALD